VLEKTIFSSFLNTESKTCRARKTLQSVGQILVTRDRKSFSISWSKNLKRYHLKLWSKLSKKKTSVEV